MSDTATPVKRTTRRKTAASTVSPSQELLTLSKQLENHEAAFTDLLSAIAKAKEEFILLKREIAETREAWEKEQEQQARELRERDQQEELERRREKEAYEYELAKTRRQAEDAFAEKKAKWEKELQERKDELAKDKAELETLQKEVAGFEAGAAKVAKEAQEELRRDLSEQFATEKKIREQEVKAEKEILILKIQTSTQENERQAKEIETLKKGLDTVTAQLKEIAVKVIESSSSPKPQIASES